MLKRQLLAVSYTFAAYSLIQEVEYRSNEIPYNFRSSRQTRRSVLEARKTSASGVSQLAIIIPRPISRAISFRARSGLRANSFNITNAWMDHVKPSCQPTKRNFFAHQELCLLAALAFTRSVASELLLLLR